MTAPIRILHLEDSDADGELVQVQLQDHGRPFSIRRVETRADFLRSLRDFDPHVILSDNSLPDIDSRSALAILREKKLETPFILVSGTVGEERAVEILRQGATDYVLKDRLSKLGPAVVRALDEAAEREARRRAESALRESLNRFCELADAMPQIVWTARADGTVDYYNRRWSEFSGASGAGWGAVLHPQDAQAFAARLQAAVADRRPYELECRFKDRRSGAWRWHLLRAVPVLDARGDVDRWFGTATDIDDRKRAEQELLRNAYYDALTKLPNRTLFENRLEKAVRAAGRDPQALLGVLFMDIDGFKQINDRFGHGTGDRLLEAFARRMEGLVRPGDTVARFGGDEFAVLLEYVGDVGHLQRIADRVLEGLRAPFAIDGHEVAACASIGVAHSATAHASTEALLRRADMAMYRAKNLGRGRIEVFDEEMQARTLEAVRLERELRQALERSELHLLYQPIVSLQSGRVTGAEALLRWTHPLRGTIPPGDFIPLAEETGLIVPVGDWVLKSACAQLRAWTDAGLDGLTLSVNVSPRQFRQDGFAAGVLAALEADRLDPRRLTLELTEGLLMEHTERSVATLRDLGARGLRFSIDDFGTGYSSLAYLRRLPCDALKIDRSFVRDAPHDPDDAAIVTAVIRMAHALRLKVVAEGVETDAQKALLRERACDEAQGYLFGKPMPPDDFFRQASSA